jgi:hypothetical protein
MNSEFMHESSKALADLAVSSAADNRPAWLVEHVLGRGATEGERLQGDSFVENYGDEKDALAAFSRVLLSSNEFLYVE